jgi:ATP adenylyltransferase
MEYMWAPWRIEYIKQATGHKEEGCFLCDNPESKDDEKNLVLYHGKLNYIVMNHFPYNAGHIMVAPNRHCGTLEGLESAERDEHFFIVSRCVAILKEVFHCDGFNVGLNLGRVAGAGMDQHIHTHIVPRWNGDTNFMPILSDTKVINEAIGETYKMLKPRFISL